VTFGKYLDLKKDAGEFRLWLKADFKASDEEVTSLLDKFN
jgi:hypothetical protein